jgi:hypothetical protein
MFCLFSLSSRIPALFATAATCSLSTFLILIGLEKQWVVATVTLCVFIPLTAIQLWVYPAHMLALGVVKFVWNGLCAAGKLLGM